MAEQRNRLYVWQGKNVFQDYGEGLICVLAPDLDTAVKLIMEKYEKANPIITLKNYKMVDKPEAFACWGSGTLF